MFVCFTLGPAWKGLSCDKGYLLAATEHTEAGGCTCVLPFGAAGFSASRTAVSRLKDGLRDTADVDGASGAATAARTWAVFLSVAAEGMLGSASCFVMEESFMCSNNELMHYVRSFVYCAWHTTEGAQEVKVNAYPVCVY